MRETSIAVKIKTYRCVDLASELAKKKRNTLVDRDRGTLRYFYFPDRLLLSWNIFCGICLLDFSESWTVN